MTAASSVLRSMRPAQWIKNSLIFGPLIFSQRFGEAQVVSRVTAAFALFCLLAGGVYLINDVLDRHKDREHPLKRNRPIASGAVAPSFAAVVGGASVLSSILLGLLLSPPFAAVAAAYLLVNLLYSRFLKNLVIIDVMTIAAGFLLRVLAGALVIPVPVSFWLLLCTGLLALFLAFGKRRHELLLLEENASSHRPILREYSPYFLDQMISVVATSTVVAYALYTISPDVREKLGTEYLGLTIPFVLYGVFRYLYLIHQKQVGGDPTQTVLTDRPLLADIALWGVAVTAILYL